MDSTLRLTLLFGANLLLGCGAGGGDGGDEPDGAALYSEPHADGNTFACATCHALEEPASDGFRRPGHPIGNAASRSSFKNGQLSSLREAVNICRTEWMNATAYEQDDANWTALQAYLSEQAPASPVEPISYEIVSPPSELSGGDPMVGQEVFNGSCSVCHGQDATGTQKAPSLSGDLLDASLVARRVRTSGSGQSQAYSGLTGGRMPFWSADRLSDDELVDIIAFVLAAGGGATTPTGGGSATDLRSCESTHDKIGQVAELETKSHRVSGTATIVDDCTVEITNFMYDGAGIDVRLYGGFPDYSDGFAMSEDLRRDGGYDGETITAQLPEGRTLDDLGGVSVWCVPVGTSFGDGTFEEQ